MFAATMSGGFLAPQIVYKGMTQACLLTVRFPDSWHIMYTHNHWCNKTTMKLYIEKVMVPYIQRKKAEQNLLSSQQAQCTSDIVKLLDHHAIDIIYVPANCNGELQPLELSANKPVKNFIKQKFQE